LSPFTNGGTLGRLTFMLFYFIFLSGGLHLLNKKRKSGIFLAFILFPFLILLADILFGLPRLVLGADLFIIIYCIWLGAIILKRTLFKGHVNEHRIAGAIVVYLLTALIFALLYHSIFLLFGQSAFKGLSHYERSEFMYFSLTTLTTVGYGDITPVNQFARSLANLEALNGQLYPAILIARLVSLEFAVSNNK
ncbi:MAG TPA: ion channel, partial [Puia sp.]|nr:ion channel [Puia sp.]